jgi:WYL domain
MERADDGSVVVEGKARSLFEVTRLLLGNGPLAEALAPAELRERVAMEVRAMARIYDEEPASTDCITSPANPSSVTQTSNKME